MYYNRKIDSYLVEWKNSAPLKPLLLRGARQVGKSSSVRNLAKSFRHFIEIDFGIDMPAKQVIEQNQNIEQICSQLALIYNTPIEDGETLLFFDEIQESPQAIKLLRYFYEKKTKLHIVAAGSLLEFALNELPSFGVGRIRSFFMYPFSFDEFLSAMGELDLLDYKKKHSINAPIAPAIHQKLLEFLRLFMLIGGMPEVVSNYVQNRNLLQVKTIINDLIISYEDDFKKYNKYTSHLHINEVFRSVLKQMGTKFTFTKAMESATHRQVKEALQLLIMSGLVIPVTHSDANGLPLGAEVNSKKSKMLPLDTGLFLQLSDLDIAEFLAHLEFSVINKGNLAELFVGLELLKSNSPNQQTSLYYWQRENNGSNAEIDYLITQNQNIIPLEVKAGTSGSMQSMRIFMQEKKSLKGIRCSLENFAQLENIEVVPMYAITNLLINFK